MSKIQDAFGPLFQLYNNPDVSGICVDSPNNIYYEESGKVIDADIKFSDNSSLLETIKNIFMLADREISADTSSADIRLFDGAQVTAVFSPVSIGPALFIKKMPAKSPSWEDLAKFGSIDKNVHALLSKILSTPNNMLIAGNAGSGKTTLINLAVNSLPEELRVISVESNFELQLNRKRGVSLEATQELPVCKLIDVAKKMLPDYLVVNELTGGETMCAISAMRLGLTTISSLHAEGTTDALNRLELMCMMSHIGVGIEEIRAMIASAVKIVTFQKRDSDGNRRVVEICEVMGLRNDKYDIRTLMKYNEQRKVFEITEDGKEWLK